MKTTITQTNELVIQGDQIFKRESFLTPLSNVNDLIGSKLKEANYSFLPLQLPPMMKRWVKSHYFGTDPKQESLLCFTEVAYIPLIGTRLNDNGTLLFFREGVDPTPFQSFDEKWTPPKDVRIFYMIPWNLQLKRICLPMLFMLAPTAQGPVTPKIPNVHDNGEICTGGDYHNRNDGEVKSTDNLPLHHIKYGLNALHDAPCNPDLRENDTQFMQWDEEGNQKELPLNSDHWRTVSDVRIVEFYNWLKKNNL